MGARFLIIDGYNLLYAAHLGQATYDYRELERCRGRLVDLLLDRLSPPELARATLIFDARHPPPDRPSSLTISGLRILFAQPTGDADVYIEELVDQHSAPRQLTVISSDRRLQRAARRRQARFLDSSRFFQELEGRELRQKERWDIARDERALAPDELAYWLSVFGHLAQELER